MSRFQLCRAHIALVSASVLVALACSKSDAPKTDTTVKAVAAIAPDSLRASPQARAFAQARKNRKTMPGDLSKPIDDYSGDEFYDFVHKLSYTGGHERTRRCRKDPGCSGIKPTRHTQVLVDAVATQDSIGPSNTPQFGVVYVRALNKGNAPEERYGMLPGKQYAYYMIVSTDSAGTGMQWRLEQLDTTPNARKHSSFGTGQFVSCNHAWVNGARADFKTCAAAAAAKDSTVKLGLALQGIQGDPIWAACAGGCCIVQ
ncbi:MAG: hypothetical protein ABJE10_19785 [bacterium]